MAKPKATISFGSILVLLILGISARVFINRSEHKQHTIHSPGPFPTHNSIELNSSTSSEFATKRDPAALPLTAFMDANADETQSLINHGENIEMKDQDGNTALFSAASLKAITLLNAHAKIEARNNLGQSPLIYNCEIGNDDAVLVLLARFASVSARDLHGTTPLLAASAHCKLETIKSLIHAGADIHDKNKDGATTLMYSLYNKDDRVFPWFLTHSPNINARGMGGNTALSIANQLRDQAKASGGPTARYEKAVGELQKHGGR